MNELMEFCKSTIFQCSPASVVLLGEIAATMCQGAMLEQMAEDGYEPAGQARAVTTYYRVKLDGEVVPCLSGEAQAGEVVVYGLGRRLSDVEPPADDLPGEHRLHDEHAGHEAPGEHFDRS
ncbi:hypothetical protein ACIBG8_54380 [Nonomuraea sp. NPDC050556]|uniref:hypothetical protein n=1 Tax=Nonomuraea sp. NPDC050556 TaxID=3364369 RepID=UPI0037B6A10D